MSNKLSDFDFSYLKGLDKIKIPNFSNKEYINPLKDSPNIDLIKNPAFDILEFLQAYTLEQSKTANKQFKTTKYLTYFIIAISIISIIPTLKELFYTNQNTILFERILELEEYKLQNTGIISDMSIHLLDLENQVKTLEKQNVMLSKKKID